MQREKANLLGLSEQISSLEPGLLFRTWNVWADLYSSRDPGIFSCACFPYLSSHVTLLLWAYLWFFIILKNRCGKGACKGVRCEADFSTNFSATPFSPTFGPTPLILSATHNFEVHKPWWMMDFFYASLVLWAVFVSL